MHSRTARLQIPGTCMVVIVVVVIRVVVVSSSMGSDDMVFLGPLWPAAEGEPKAVVSSPGDMTVAVDSAWPSPGTACVGLVVVPAESREADVRHLRVKVPVCSDWDVSALLCCRVSTPVPDWPKYSLLCRAAWITPPNG